jgi:hypothetical protein
LETFREPKDFVDDPNFLKVREAALTALDLSSVDKPIVDILSGFAAVPHCFSLQCCFGHFLCSPKSDPHSLEPIPSDYQGQVRYRIAYIALALENSRRGLALRESLCRLTAIDADFVHFGSPGWFWERRVNSYVLQVEPIADKFKDEALLDFAEALHTQRVRDLFFKELRGLMAREIRAHAER